jgi:hypothetical protein
LWDLSPHRCDSCRAINDIPVILLRMKSGEEGLLVHRAGSASRGRELGAFCSFDDRDEQDPLLCVQAFHQADFSET